MAKFKSLFFRELRVSQKNMIIRAVLLIVFGRFFVAAISTARSESFEFTGTNVISVIACTSLFTGIMAVLLGNMRTDILKSDINAGWLTYSYTVPVEPRDRALITLTVNCGFTLLLLAVGLGFTAVYCAVGETPFSASYISAYAVIFSAATLLHIVTDRFILRSRSLAELKSSMLHIELGTLGAIIVIVAIFFGKIKHFLFPDDSFPLYKLLDTLNGKMLIWLIPLCIVLLFADYLVIKRSMQSAYSADKDNTKTQIQEKETLSDTHSCPTGFLYKELKQNRLFIILTALLPLILLMFNYMMLYLMAVTGENKPAFSDVLADGENTIIRFLMIVGAYVASGLIAGIFSGDDRKLYAYFTVSTPQGVRGSLYYKYFLAFAMNGLFMVSSIFAGSIYDTLYYAITGKENTSLDTLYRVIFFLLLTICAWDIPFMIRFGQKKGIYIKTALMLGISTILVVTFDYLTDPIKDEVVMKLFSAVMGGEISDNMMLGISFVPILCAAAFYLSYKFSCKLFMRGVDGYDK